MTIEEVVKELGGTVSLADRLMVKPAAVSQWISQGAIPPLRAIQIEQMTGGQYRAADLIDWEGRSNG